MKQQIIPFQRLHIPDEAMGRAELVAWQAALSACADPRERLRLLGKGGERQYLLGEFAAAITDLHAAVALARHLEDQRGAVANLIRLATALQYADRHAEAAPIFRQALALTADPRVRDYADFAYQHFGKCLLEMGCMPEGIACFERALVLRQTKGDVGLLASTRQALDEARGRVDAE